MSKQEGSWEKKSTGPGTGGFHPDVKELSVQVCEVDEAMKEDRLLALSQGNHMKLVPSEAVPEL